MQRHAMQRQAAGGTRCSGAPAPGRGALGAAARSHACRTPRGHQLGARGAAAAPRAAPGAGGAPSSSGGGSGAQAAAPAPMVVYFKAEDIITEALPGDVIMEVAEKAGITIPGGCYSGNCGICEVEVKKVAAGESAAGAGAGAVVRACVARLPPGYARVEIEMLQDDAIWGLDGFDT
ncbi:MAG: hypothetical protein J3K34DRAFT_523129 [Monoraphidium minutum]|nr:MAG: hypothetical protein J3K34DRAFT_523129 [Monoraphidium minutum]